MGIPEIRGKGHKHKLQPSKSNVNLASSKDRSAIAYGMGWNNKSGKNRLNSIRIPAVKVIQAAANTGAEDKNLDIAFSK
jgi:hypothetical protein